MKDYVRKPYMGKSYYEFTRRPSRKHLQNIKLQKESEFEKPYRKDEYPEMQHFAPSSEPAPWSPGTPGTPGNPEVSGEPGSAGSPWPPYPPGPPGDPGSPYPPGGPWWPDEPPTPGNTECPPNMQCNPRNSGQVDTDGCGLVFVGGMCGTRIAARLLAISSPGFKIRGSGNNFSCEHCQPSAFVEVCYSGSDSDATAYIEFVDMQFSDRLTAYVVCTIKANCCTLATQISYSSGNPATIGQSTEATITVDDGCGPFSWSVSGTGYSFAQPKTASRSNTLIADGSACGTATITVTDDCADTATGYVRNTTGGWVQKSAICEMSGVGTTGDGGSTWELITGNKKQTQSVVKVGTCNDACDQCGDLCGCSGCCNDGGAGCSGLACESCIDYWSEWGGYLVPYIQYVAGEQTKCNYYYTSSLSYYEWEC